MSHSQMVSVDSERDVVTKFVGMRAAFMVAFVTISLSACSNGGEVDTGPADSGTAEIVETEEPEAAAPVPTEEAMPATILADQWTDADGYSFTFDLTAPVSDPLIDVANARPGEAEIIWSYSFTGQVTNATPQRNAPTPLISVQPVWPATSKVCALASTTSNQPFIENGFSFPYADGEDLWCAFANAPHALVGPTDLTIGETAAISGSASNANFPLVVPEADADAILAELKDPPIWALGREHVESDAGQCYIGEGSVYVAAVTVDTGCAV